MSFRYYCDWCQGEIIRPEQSDTPEPLLQVTYDLGMAADGVTYLAGNYDFESVEHMRLKMESLQAQLPQ
jgi:hypothetical protein